MKRRLLTIIITLLLFVGVFPCNQLFADTNEEIITVDSFSKKSSQKLAMLDFALGNEEGFGKQAILKHVVNSDNYKKIDNIYELLGVSMEPEFIEKNDSLEKAIELIYVLFSEELFLPNYMCNYTNINLYRYCIDELMSIKDYIIAIIDYFSKNSFEDLSEDEDSRIYIYEYLNNIGEGLNVLFENTFTQEFIDEERPGDYDSAQAKAEYFESYKNHFFGSSNIDYNLNNYLKEYCKFTNYVTDYRTVLTNWENNDDFKELDGLANYIQNDKLFDEEGNVNEDGLKYCNTIMGYIVPSFYTEINAIRSCILNHYSNEEGIFSEYFLKYINDFSVALYKTIDMNEAFIEKDLPNIILLVNETYNELSFACSYMKEEYYAIDKNFYDYYELEYAKEYGRTRLYGAYNNNTNELSEKKLNKYLDLLDSQDVIENVYSIANKGVTEILSVEVDNCNKYNVLSADGYNPISKRTDDGIVNLNIDDVNEDVVNTINNKVSNKHGLIDSVKTIKLSISNDSFEDITDLGKDNIANIELDIKNGDNNTCVYRYVNNELIALDLDNSSDSYYEINKDGNIVLHTRYLGTFVVVDYSDIAKIGEITYPTLMDAINNAKTNDVIEMINDDLNADSNKYLFIGSGKTLDLNGYDVVCGNITCVGKIIDSKTDDEKGSITVDECFVYPKVVTQSNDSKDYVEYIPVKDNDTNTYRFYNVIVGYNKVSSLTGTNKNGTKQAVFGSWVENKNVILRDGGNVTLGVRAIANTNEIIEDGEVVDGNSGNPVDGSITLDFVFHRNIIDKYLQDNGKLTPGFTWTGISNFDSLRINGFVYSSSAFYRYDGKYTNLDLTNSISKTID